MLSQTFILLAALPLGSPKGRQQIFGQEQLSIMLQVPQNRTFEGTCSEWLMGWCWRVVGEAVHLSGVFSLRTGVRSSAAT